MITLTVRRHHTMRGRSSPAIDYFDFTYFFLYNRHMDITDKTIIISVVLNFEKGKQVFYKS